MDLIISGKDFRLTPSLKTYVQDKIGKLGRYWSKIIRARVELDVDHNQKSGDIYRVEAKLEVPGPDIRLGAKASDMHVAIDTVARKLEILITKAKDKVTSRHRPRQGKGNTSDAV